MTASRWTWMEGLLAFAGGLLVLCAASLVVFWVFGALPALLVAAAQLEPPATRPAVAMVARLIAWRWAMVGGWLVVLGATLLLLRSLARPGVKLLILGLVATSASAILLLLMVVLSAAPVTEVIAELQREGWR